MTIKKLAASALIISFSAISANVLADDSKLILGKWDCTSITSADGMDMNLNISQNYQADGTNDAVANLTLKAEAMGMDVAFEMQAQSNWYIEDGFLVETIVSGSATSLKSSPFESMFSEADLIPVGVTESVKILTLTKTDLVVESEGQEIICKR